ncbi:MAG: response regulator [Candidatus Adiutrix sp.]|jgi:two-component system phosphate regulon response regulator PhoB|nr:response regulator [Candidatus Adiutrix sp.]
MQILIIEDEEALRELLDYEFRRLEIGVLALDNANDALMAVEDCPPDLILLDLMLPGLKGLQFLDILRREGNDVPVIIISARNAETDIINALERGADDYVTKPFSFNFLEAKMKAVLRRGGEIKSSPKFSLGGVSVDLEAHKAFSDGQALPLTQKEFELLTLFMRKAGRAFTRNQLLNSIWGYDSSLVSRTVDVHVASLRKKLGDKGRYIQTVPKIGYLWEISNF